jgi:hypothetical protein
MKAFLIPFATMAFATLMAAPARAEEAAPSTAAIEQCVRDNATKVEAAIADLNQAVEFLVKKICAGPVAERNALLSKRQQDQMAASWKAMCDKQKAAKTMADDSAKSALDVCAMRDYSAGFTGIVSGDDDAPAYLAGNVPPVAVALASSLLLDLRLSHLKSGQPH